MVVFIQFRFRKILKNFLPSARHRIFQVLDSNGLNWEVDSRLALDRHKILGLGDMVPEFIQFLWKHLEIDMPAIDVGANAGYWTIPMSKKFSNVIAFEPNLSVRGKLLRNLELNNVTNVSARSELCGSEEGVRNFFEISLKDGDGLLNNGLSSTINRGLNLNSITKQMISIDSLGLDEVAFLKIDVEGMEFEVLSGAVNLIRSCHPIVFWEASRTLDLNHGLTNVEDSLRLLTSNNYCHFMFLDNQFTEISSDSRNLEMLRDFDILSVPSSKASQTRLLLLAFQSGE